MSRPRHRGQPRGTSRARHARRAGERAVASEKPPGSTPQGPNPVTIRLYDASGIFTSWSGSQVRWLVRPNPGPCTMRWPRTPDPVFDLYPLPAPDAVPPSALHPQGLSTDQRAACTARPYGVLLVTATPPRASQCSRTGTATGDHSSDQAPSPRQGGTPRGGAPLYPTFLPSLSSPSPLRF